MNQKQKSRQDISFQKSSNCKYSMAPSNTISWNHTHTHIGWKRLLLNTP